MECVPVTYHVRSQVDAEDGDGPQREWNVCNNKYQEGGNLRKDDLEPGVAGLEAVR